MSFVGLDASAVRAIQSCAILWDLRLGRRCKDISCFMPWAQVTNQGMRELLPAL
jgi:hypothetical protein